MNVKAKRKKIIKRNNYDVVSKFTVHANLFEFELFMVFSSYICAFAFCLCFLFLFVLLTQWHAEGNLLKY